MSICTCDPKIGREDPVLANVVKLDSLEEYAAEGNSYHIKRDMFLDKYLPYYDVIRDK